MTTTGTRTARTKKPAGRSQPSAAEREAAREARNARVAELHEQLGQQVTDLAQSEAWRRMLETAARFRTYSLRNQLLISMQAGQRGFTATHVAGFTAWKAMGRNVAKGAKGIAILAPCTYTKDSESPAGASSAPVAAPETAPAATGEQGAARVLRGFKIAHVFDVSQTEGEPLAVVAPVLLTGDAPAALWEALAAQVAAHGYTVERGHCGGANGYTDPTRRVVRVRADVEDAQAAKTLAHELGHIECQHLGDGYDYRSCRGRAETEAESVAYVVTAWAGLDCGAYSVPYVAGWAGGDTAAVQAAAETVTAAARRILDRIDADQDAAQDVRTDQDAHALVA